MTVVDTLQILVEADARGIDQVLKNVISTVTGTVGQINKQEVDWTSIFSRAVTPALIGGIGSMFAFAIAQSLQFQQALNTTGTAAGESSSQIAQTGQAAIEMSKIVPSSAQDIANAMMQVSSIFGTNTLATQTITEAMSKLAASGFGDLDEIVASSMDIFRQWGVTTTEQAVSVLTDLMHGAQGAKESIPALANQFSQISPSLREANIGLDSLNQILGTFSGTVETLGANQASAIFTSLGDAASNSNPALASLGGGMEAVRRSLIDNGGLSAIKTMSSTMSKEFGNNIGLIASNFGLGAVNVEGFINAGKQLPTISENSKGVIASTQSISDAYKQSDSAVRELHIAWNSFVSDAVKFGSTFIPVITELVKGFDLLAQAAGGFFDLVKGSTTTAVSGLANMVTSVGGFFSNLFSGGQTDKLNAALQKTGVGGLSGGVLSRIDQTASQSGLIDSLLSALQTGIKGGQYATLVNTFHLNVPAGSAGLTAKQIAAQLYSQFQGTQ